MLELLGFVCVVPIIMVIIILGMVTICWIIGKSGRTILKRRESGGGCDGIYFGFPVGISVFLSAAALTAPTSHSPLLFSLRCQNCFCGPVLALRENMWACYSKGPTRLVFFFPLFIIIFLNEAIQLCLRFFLKKKNLCLS